MQHNVMLRRIPIMCAIMSVVGLTTQVSSQTISTGATSVAVVVDGSGSVHPDGFKVSLRLAEKLVAKLYETDNATKVALIVYGTKAHVVFNGVGDVLDTTAMQMSFSNISYPGTRTYTANALDLARETLGSSPGQALVLITDGLSMDSATVLSTAASKLKNTGVEIIAISTSPNVLNRKQSLGLEAAALAELARITGSTPSEPRVILTRNENDEDVVARVTSAIRSNDASIAPQVNWFDLDMNVKELTIGFTFPIQLGSFNPQALTLRNNKQSRDQTSVTLHADTKVEGAGGIGSEYNVVHITLLDADYVRLQQLFLPQNNHIFLTADADAFYDVHGNFITPVASMEARQLRQDTAPMLLRAGNLRPGLMRLRFSEPLSWFDISKLSIQDRIMNSDVQNMTTVQFPTGTAAGRITGQSKQRVDVQLTVEALELLRSAGIAGRAFVKIDKGCVTDTTGKSSESAIMFVSDLGNDDKQPGSGRESGSGSMWEASGSGSGSGKDSEGDSAIPTQPSTTTTSATTTTAADTPHTLFDCMGGCVDLSYTPVCGANGITFPNKCHARCAGVTFFHPWACGNEPSTVTTTTTTGTKTSTTTATTTTVSFTTSTTTTATTATVTSTTGTTTTTGTETSTTTGTTTTGTSSSTTTTVICKDDIACGSESLPSWFCHGTAADFTAVSYLPRDFVPKLVEMTQALCPAMCDMCGSKATDPSIGRECLAPLNLAYTSADSCEEGEVEVVGLRKSSSRRLCRKIKAWDSTPKNAVSAAVNVKSGQGFVESTFRKLENGAYEGVLQSVGSVAEASATIKIGDVVLDTGTQHISQEDRAAESARGLLRTPFVFRDAPEVQATFKLVGANQLGAPTAETTVTIGIAVNNELGENMNLLFSNTVTCRPAQFEEGICDAGVTIPEVVFTRLERATTYQVFYGINGGSGGTHLGPVTVVKAFTGANVPRDAIYTVLPARELLPGDFFDLEVRSTFQLALKTAEIKVEVSGPLELIDSQIALDGPLSSFSGKILVNPEGASASIGRSLSPADLDGSTSTSDELLFTIRVRVTDSGGAPTVSLTSLALQDSKNVAIQHKIDAVVSRRGVTEGYPGKVYVGDNAFIGIFAVPQKSAILVNTVAIAYNKNPIIVPIFTYGIQRRGGRINLTRIAQCKSTNPNALGVSKQGCNAMLDGTETTGAELAAISVSVSIRDTARFADHANFNLFYPSSITAIPDSCGLRPINGVFAADDSTCTTPRYQESLVDVRAEFRDSASGVMYVDVGAILDLFSSDESVVTVSRSDGRLKIVGVGPGSTTVKARASGGNIMSTFEVMVADPSIKSNFINVIALDIFSYTNPWKISTAIVRRKDSGVAAKITVEPEAVGLLQYPGDTVDVVISAIFEDHTTMTLDSTSGVMITSAEPRALFHKANDHFGTFTVPNDPVAYTANASQALLSVFWQPNETCRRDNFADVPVANAEVALSVTPPLADSMVATCSEQVIVCTGDIASASGADFPTQAAIKVSLQFEDKVIDNLETRNYTSYKVSDPTVATVSADGLIVANDRGIVGTVTVLVHYKGQEVTDKVTVKVVKYEALIVSASPYPSYGNSNRQVSVTELAPIASTDPLLYQQALLWVKLVLTNGDYKFISRKDSSLEIVDGVLADLSSDGVLSVQEPGTLAIKATFASKTSEEMLAVRVTEDFVSVVSLNNMKIRGGSDLVGKKGKMSQILLGATLSDGRRYDTLFSTSGIPTLPGLVSFGSEMPSSASVDGTRGVTMLKNNYHSSVTLTAYVDNNAMSSVDVTCNLQPGRLGDVDLGQNQGVPVVPQKVGEAFSVPVKVNAGIYKIGGYSIVVQFDSAQLELLGVRNAVSQDNGVVDMRHSVSQSGNEVLFVATIQRTDGTAIAQGIEEVAFLDFVAKTPGEAVITGITQELVDDTPVTPVEIGDQPTLFEAGDISLIILGSGRGRRVYATTNVAHAQQLQTVGMQIRKRERRDTCDTTVQGDTNCDCKLTIADPIRVHEYVAGRNIEFAGVATSVKNAVNSCSVDLGSSELMLKALDTDQNDVINSGDAVFLLDVMVENFYFVTATNVKTDSDSCVFNFEVTLASGNSNLPREDTAVYLELVYPASSSFGVNVRKTQGALVSSPTAEYDRALVRATRLSAVGGVYQLTVPAVEADVIDVGVTVIQVAGPSMAVAPRWRVFDKASTITYTFPLKYSADELGASWPLAGSSAGYSPFTRTSISGDTCAATTTASSTTDTTTTTFSSTTTATVSSTTDTDTSTSVSTTTDTDTSTTGTDTSTTVSTTTGTDTSTTNTDTSTTDSTSTATDTSTTVSTTTGTDTSTTISTTTGTDTSTTGTDTTTTVSSTTTSLTSTSTSTPTTTTFTGTTLTVASKPTTSRTTTTSKSTAITTTSTTTPITSSTVTATSSTAYSTTGTDTTGTTATATPTPTTTPFTPEKPNSTPAVTQAFLIYFDLLNGPFGSLMPILKLVFNKPVSPTSVNPGTFRLQSSASANASSIIIDGASVENDPLLQNIVLVTFTNDDIANLMAAGGLAREYDSTFISTAAAIVSREGVQVKPIAPSAAQQVRLYDLSPSAFVSTTISIDGGNQNLVGQTTPAPVDAPPTFIGSTLDIGAGTLMLSFQKPVDYNTIQMDKLKIHSTILNTNVFHQFALTNGIASQFQGSSTAVLISMTAKMQNMLKLSGISLSPMSAISADLGFIASADGVIANVIDPVKVTTFIADDVAPRLLSFGLDITAGMIVMNFTEPVNSEAADFRGIAFQSTASNPLHTFSLSTGFIPKQQKSAGAAVTVELYMPVTDIQQLIDIPMLASSLETTFLTIQSDSLTDMSGNPVQGISSREALPAVYFRSVPGTSQSTDVSGKSYTGSTKALIGSAISFVLLVVFVLVFIAPRWQATRQGNTLIAPPYWDIKSPQKEAPVGDLEWDTHLNSEVPSQTSVTDLHSELSHNNDNIERPSSSGSRQVQAPELAAKIASSSYVAVQDNELTIHEGELLLIHPEPAGCPDGFRYATNEHHQTGLVMMHMIGDIRVSEEAGEFSQDGGALNDEEYIEVENYSSSSHTASLMI